MFGIRALILYKIAGGITLLLNALIKLDIVYIPNYSFFSFLGTSLTNALFSLAIVVILFLVKEENYKFFTLFNVLIFIDTLLVYQAKGNFIIHIAVLVALTQIYYRIKIRVAEKKSIAEHLVEED